MNIKNLHYFLHLCDSKCFSKTAASLHISPSALSRIIQRLESDLDQQLLIRTNRSVELTPAGRKLAPVAMQIVNGWQAIKSELRGAEALLSGKLTLFCSVTASYSHLPDLLNRFRQHYPHIELQLLTGDPAQATGMIKDGIADIAIAAKPHKMSGSLMFKALDQVSMSIITPQLGLPEFGNEKSEDYWDQVPLILPESGPARESADQWLRAKTRRPNIYAQIAGHEGIVSMVALGCGIGVAPDVVIDNSPVKDKVERLKQETVSPLELGLCCKKARADEPLLSALLHLLV